MRAEYSRRGGDTDAGPLLATSTHPSRSGGHLAPVLLDGTRAVTGPCPHVHGLRLRASTPARKPSPEVGASSNCIGASLRRDRRFVARASSSPSPPIRARCRERTAPLRMRSADVMCVLMPRGDDLGRSRRSEVLRGMRRSLGLRAGEDGRGAGVTLERHGETAGIRRCGGFARMVGIPGSLAASRMPVFLTNRISSRRTTSSQTARKEPRTRSPNSPIAPGHFDGFTHPPGATLPPPRAALGARPAYGLACSGKQRGGTTSPLARARGPSEIGPPHWICDRGEFHGGGPSRLIESYGSPCTGVQRWLKKMREGSIRR
ncbi:hypothetical protein DFH09DRAFT_1171685 [Mycena vulgaris]|nr:hypothetical protein DFH09DRAFT_1171685 [Mycena vulgaris]